MDVSIWYTQAWWLRRASYRSRCRLLAECATAFGVKVVCIKVREREMGRVLSSVYDKQITTLHRQDIHSFDTASASSEVGVRIAVPTIDTVTHDMSVTSNTEIDDTVQVFDGCVNIGDIRNGLLCSMHPSEVCIHLSCIILSFTSETSYVGFQWCNVPPEFSEPPDGEIH